MALSIAPAAQGSVGPRLQPSTGEAATEPARDILLVAIELGTEFCPERFLLSRNLQPVDQQDEGPHRDHRQPGKVNNRVRKQHGRHPEIHRIAGQSIRSVGDQRPHSGHIDWVHSCLLATKDPDTATDQPGGGPGQGRSRDHRSGRWPGSDAKQTLKTRRASHQRSWRNASDHHLDPRRRLFRGLLHPRANSGSAAPIQQPRPAATAWMGAPTLHWETRKQLQQMVKSPTADRGTAARRVSRQPLVSISRMLTGETSKVGDEPTDSAQHQPVEYVLHAQFGPLASSTP